MRKFLSFMLLASAATAPALAAPGDWSDRQQARSERQQAREDRSAARAESTDSRRETAPAYEPRQRMVDNQAMAARPQAPERPDLQALRAGRAGMSDAPRNWRGTQREPMVQGGQRPDTMMYRDRVAQQRQTARERIAARGQLRPPIVSQTPRPGTQPPPPTAQRPTPMPNWNSNWRHDRRYDWNDYRRRHYSLFNLGFYYDPFGWGYQPYQIGWRMWPSYYGSNFWLNDPWQYRLPYAPPGYRWVRYWNDAVLVDTWSGQVVDVIYSFFW